MILDHHTHKSSANNMGLQHNDFDTTTATAPVDQRPPPPAYDIAPTSNGSSSDYGYTSSPLPSSSQPLPPSDKQDVKNGPPHSPVLPHAPMMPTTTVYHYIHPFTGEQINSLLPPNHPEMVCLQQGGHEPHSKFGLLGVLAAVLWFPLGIGLCLLDRRVQCKRCGYMIDSGVCG